MSQDIIDNDGLSEFDRRFRIDLTRPLEGAGGGLPAYAVTDTTEPDLRLMAVQVDRAVPARAAMFAPLLDRIDNLLTPVAYIRGSTGPGGPTPFVVALAPLGPSLAAEPRVWPEEEVVRRVLLLSVNVLTSLYDRGLILAAPTPDSRWSLGIGVKS